MPYELTQIRIHLQRVMREIGDILTSPEDIARYEDFNNKMKKLAAQTALHYSNNIPLTQELANILRAAYADVLEAAVTLVQDENETGPAGLRLKTVARELVPLLQTDVQALDQIEMSGNPEFRTLPELLGEVRMKAADLGEEELPADGAPLPIRVESVDDIQRGIFIPADANTAQRPADANAAQRPAAAYARLAGLLGVPDLVSRATPMLLRHKGGTTAGTFIPDADGINPAQIQANHPFLTFGTENLDTDAAISGIASMGLLNCLFGVPADDASYSLLFDRPYSTADAPAKLVGLTVRPEGVRFDAAPAEADVVKAQLAALSVIPAEMVAMLTADGFAEQLRYTLHGCGLPADAANRILARRDILLEKIREDADFYKDKAPGYVEPGRIRVVPTDEMDAYHLENLAAINTGGPFATLKQLPEKTKADLQQKADPRPITMIPTARIIGTGLAQEPDPYGTSRPDALRLHIPLLGAKSLAGGVNQRYPIGWEENGRIRKGVFSLPNVHSANARISEILQPFLTDPKNLQYRDLLRAIETYYHVSDTNKEVVELPTLDRMPWRTLGISEERGTELENDPAAKALFHQIESKVMRAAMLLHTEDRAGAERGERIDLRNVAMSDVADALGVPNLLARAVPAKVELNGKIVDGVFMEEAEGIDLSKVRPGTTPATITSAMNADVFNTKGLKNLADLQILDFICLNRDRHSNNMFYKFADLGTDHPKFLGVQGIDNDFSFGTEVPKDTESINHLPKLNDIRVISASMAATLRTPGCMDRIAEKMRRDGKSEAQIQAARDRFEKIRKKLNKGKLDVVRDDQWGKGKYRIETLGEGTLFSNTSIFSIFKNKVIAGLNQMAETHPVEPGKTVPIAEMDVQMVRRVEDFTDTTLRATELAALEKQAEKDFLERAAAATATGPRAENPEHQAVFELHSIATTLKAELDAGALPWPWGNRSYRKMHSACEDLVKFTGKLSEKLRRNPEAEISAEDSKKLSELIRETSNKSAAYWTYKLEDLKTYDPGESTARRQNAADHCNKTLYARYSMYKAARQERLSPIHLVHEQVRALQGGLGAASGDELRRKAAQIVYLNGLSRMEIGKKSGMGLRRALTEVKLQEQPQQVLDSPAFKKLAALPDQELRALAAGQGGTALADKFIQELAKEQQLKNAPRPAGYQAPAPEVHPVEPQGPGV